MTPIHPLAKKLMEQYAPSTELYSKLISEWLEEKAKEIQLKAFENRDSIQGQGLHIVLSELREILGLSEPTTDSVETGSKLVAESGTSREWPFWCEHVSLSGRDQGYFTIHTPDWSSDYPMKKEWNFCPVCATTRPKKKELWEVLRDAENNGMLWPVGDPQKWQWQATKALEWFKENRE